MSVYSQTSLQYDLPGDLSSQSNASTIDLPQFQQVGPQFIGVASNGLVAISVPVTGVGPITYEWLLNRAPVFGATNDSFIIANATTANLGNYQLVAANSAGAITSAVVNVSFFDPSGSGLPLAWETNYFGTNGLSAFADPDHSGAPLYQDYQQGFNPSAAGSANAYYTTGLYWLNGNGGNWSTATNWSIGQVPGPISSPVITVGGNYTVTLDTPATVNNLTVGSSSGVQTVSIPAGQTLTLISGGTFNAQGQLEMTNSTLAVGNAGQVTLAGGGTNSGGNFQLGLGASVDLSGSSWLWQGMVQGSGQGTVMLSGGAYVNGSSGLTLNFSASDPLEMNGGQLRGAITNLGSVEIAGSAANWLLDPISFFNQGLVQATDGSALWFNTCGSGPANFYNLAGGIYQFAGDCVVTQVCTGSDFFQNQGLVWKSAGSGTASILVPFNNLGGAVQVDSGTLVLSTGGYAQGSSSNGTFTVASGAALDLTGGSSPTWAGQMNGGGAGSVLLSSGTLEASNLTLAFTNSLFHWTGGTINGTITNVGTVELSGTNAGALANPTTFVNQGLVQETASGGLGFNTCNNKTTALYNQVGATYQFTTDSTIIQYCTGTGLFQNQGLVWKSGGTNTTTIAVPFDNLGGAIQVDSGTLVLSTGGYGEGSSSNGTFTVASGAALDLTGGSTPTWAGQMTGSGAGAVLLSSGTLIASNLTLAFSNGLFQWCGGALTGTATNVETLAVSGTNYSDLSGGIFVNEGLVQETANAGLLFGNCSGKPPRFYNLPGAAYQILGDSAILQNNCSAAALFQNQGLLWKSGGSNTTVISVPFSNLGGTIEADSGTLALDVTNGINGNGSSSNATLVVAGGASLIISGDANPTWAGQWIGSGAGNVLLRGGLIRCTPSLTLNCASNLLQSSNGSLSGTITNLTTLDLVGTNFTSLAYGSTFVNRGLVRASGTGGLFLNICTGPAVFANLPGATYEFLTDSSIFQNNCGGTLFFQNQGLLWKSGGTNTTTICVPFNNLGGSIEVDSGALDFDTSLIGGIGGNAYGNGAGTSSNATFIVAAGAALDLADNNPTWAGLMTGSGAGTVLLSNLTLNASPSVTLNFATNMLQCNGAGLAGTLTNLGMVKLVGTNASVLLSRATFVNRGLVQEAGSGGLLITDCGGGPTAFYNLAGGTYQFTTDSSIYEPNCGGTLFFQNQGLFWKSGGTNTTTIAVPFNNLGGSVEVDSGTLLLNDLLDGGNDAVNGSSSYSQGGGSFTVQLGGTNAGQNGQLDVVGNVSLAGPLNVKVASGFAPAIGSEFQILTCSNRTGTFGPLNVPQGIAVNYSANGVFLVVTGAVSVQIQSPQAAGGNFSFNFATANGQSYTVQDNTNLTTPSWSFLTNITGNGSLYLFTLPVTNVPQLFFRVSEP